MPGKRPASASISTGAIDDLPARSRAFRAMAALRALSPLAIDTLLGEVVESGRLPGVVAGAVTRDGLIYRGAFGRRGPNDPSPMTWDTVFWIASMTKAITSVAAMQMVERGVLSLDRPLDGLLPELARPQILEGFSSAGEPILRPARGGITLAHLLSHTSGLAEDIWSPKIAAYARWKGLPPSTERRLASLWLPLLFEPGTGWQYGVGHEVAGLAMERATDRTIDDLVRENVFEPLGIADSGWELPAEAATRKAGVAMRRGPDRFEPFVRELPPTREYLPAGGALQSTAGDYLAFVRAILDDGMVGRSRILEAATLDVMSRNQSGDAAVGRLVPGIPELSNVIDFMPATRCCWGLGMQVNLETTRTGRQPGSWSWAGLGNTCYWIDRASGVGGVLLAQILPFGDPVVFDLFERFEAAIYRETGLTQ